MPFLKVQPGEAVAVRIINEAGHDAASTVTVDGLSMFTFRDDKANNNEHVDRQAPHRPATSSAGSATTRRSSVFLVADLPRDHPASCAAEEPGQYRRDHRDLRRRLGRENQRPSRRGRHAGPGHRDRTRRPIDALMKPSSATSVDSRGGDGALR